MDMNNSPALILIGGPTASGKSALAVELAQKVNGVIINADSMQVYAGLPILTAQPDENQLNLIPHRLYGVLDPAEACSAGRWRTLAQQAIKDVVKSGQTPILVGGTGMYFSALLGGLADIPEIPTHVRETGRQLYDEIGEDNFRFELSKSDEDSARKIRFGDRQRLLRAWEVVTHTGTPLGVWQKQSAAHHEYSDYALDYHLVMPERDALYAACNKRFDSMIEHGALEEVKALLARQLDPVLPAMKILGVRELASYLRGEMSLELAVEKAKQATRNYAKRQMTWFRHRWPPTMLYRSSTAV